MNHNTLKKLACGLLVASALSTTAVMASPIPIDGSISFEGNAGLNSSNLSTTTAFTGFSGITVNTTSGAYTTIPTLSGDGVVFDPTGFSFEPSVGILIPGIGYANAAPVSGSLLTTPLWTFTTSGGVTYTFDASGIISTLQGTYTTGGQFLDLSGSGLAIISGGSTDYLPTNGSWTIDMTQTGTTFSFGSTAGASAPTPDSGTSLLLIALGFGAIGLGVIAQRRRGAKI